MELSVLGAGHVGATVSACLAGAGHSVVAIDVDGGVVDRLNDGAAPIYEPGLDGRIEAVAGAGLVATTDYAAAAETAATFVTLPTPTDDDGTIDTSTIEAGTRHLGEVMADRDDPHLVVVKSTVLPGTTARVVEPALEAGGLTLDRDRFDVAVNPEFLREGSAVRDFTDPDKVVFGTRSDFARESLRAVYEPVHDGADPAVVDTGLREAEFIKYANNAFLATKVSLINEIGNIAKRYGVDTYEVAEAIGADHRIAARFLRSGVGWGGNCFPKDVSALTAAARARDYEPVLLDAAVELNKQQPERMLDLLSRHVEIDGKRIAVLGLAFKPDTADVRSSPAIRVVQGLEDRNADVVAYDPVAMENARGAMPGLRIADSAAEALAGSHGAVVVTDWPEFSALDAEFDRMADPVVVDGRRTIRRRAGLTYEGLTW